MIPTCSFRCPRAACEALDKIACLEIGKTTRVNRLPYQHQYPEYTNWWLSPTIASPAYMHGKFFFDWGGDDSILCGFYVEKGLDPKVLQTKLYTSAKAKRFIMQPDWIWHQFLHDCYSGRIESAIRAAAKALPFPVIVRIDGGYCEDPSVFDPHKSLLKNDVYLLQWEKESELFRLIESKLEARLLGDLAKVKIFSDLFSFFSKMNDDPFLWLDTFFAIRLHNKNIEIIPDTEREEWNAEMIWSRFFKFFLPWFK